MKVLLDSSGWIEFFTDGPLAERYAPYLTSRYQRIKPSQGLNTGSNPVGTTNTNARTNART
ncbi:MAG: type II toxin-antitoxin system VapC family toxin [Nitrospira sp. CG24A]|nr:MAG: type II toxin-antitoxin system VapC family toxin [Nitrospira sp. CG24A]